MTTMETKHTKGPWEVASKTKRFGCPIIEVRSIYQDGAINYRILGAIVHVLGHCEESEATAKLVASAPDMLEYCLLENQFNAEGAIRYAGKEYVGAYGRAKLTELRIEAIKKATE